MAAAFHNNGTSAFALAQSLPLAGTGTGTVEWVNEPIAPVLADLDADRHVDIAVVGDSGVTIFFGDGTGSYRSRAHPSPSAAVRRISRRST
jgi:hypothetical protein